MIVTEPAPLMPIGGVDGNGLYGRQTLRGNLAFGGGPHEWIATEPGGPAARPGSPLIRSLARRVAEMFPKAAHLNVIRSWAGIVENTPDGRPVLDRVGNVTVATMSGVGFGLSPASGHAVRDLVVDGACSFADIAKLGLARFAGLEPDWRERRGWAADAASALRHDALFGAFPAARRGLGAEALGPGVARPRAEEALRYRRHRRRRPRPVDRLLPRQGARRDQRRRARKGLDRRRQHRAQHDHRPLELPPAGAAPLLRHGARPVGGDERRVELQRHVLAPRRAVPRPFGRRHAPARRTRRRAALFGDRRRPAEPRRRGEAGAVARRVARRALPGARRADPAPRRHRAPRRRRVGLCPRRRRARGRRHPELRGHRARHRRRDAWRGSRPAAG